MTPRDALALMERITRLPQHDFWLDDLSLEAAFGLDPPIVGHRQVVDGYLLALAVEHGGMLATLDRGLVALAGKEANLVVLSANPLESV